MHDLLQPSTPMLQLTRTRRPSFEIHSIFRMAWARCMSLSFSLPAANVGGRRSVALTTLTQCTQPVGGVGQLSWSVGTLHAIQQSGPKGMA
jgi:hypothetical protein